MTTVGQDAQPTGNRGLGPRFARLLVAQSATNLGDGLLSVAVVWFASTLTRDATLVALVALASRLPWLLVSLPAGVLADRVDRRLLVGWTDVARTVVAAALAAVVLAVQDSLPSPAALAGGAPEPEHAGLLVAVLCVASFLLGVAEVVRDNAAQTLLPAFVPEDRLESANGRLSAAEITTNSFLGPPLGGALVAFALVLPFALDAALLAASAVLLLTLRPTPRPALARTGAVGWRAQTAEGFGWLWRHRALRLLAILLGAMNFLSALALTVSVLFVQDVLGLFEGWQFGLVTTGTAVGALLGSFVSARVSRRLGSGTSLVVSVAVMGAMLALMGATSSAWVFWATGLGLGLGIVLWNVITVSLRQRLVPDDLLGRVNSVYRFFGWGTIAIGTVLGGVLVSATEASLGRDGALRLPFLVAGLGTLALLVVAPRLRTALATATDRADERATVDRGA